MNLFDKYILDYVDLYALSLMPNHFHFFLRIKDFELKKDETIDFFISRQFRLFFMSYSKAINKEQGRTGSLFQKNFKRKLVENEDYFTSLIAYIHLNPIEAKLVKDFSAWPYSSYADLLSLEPTRLARNTVLDWFGGRSRFIQFHKELLD